MKTVFYSLMLIICIINTSCIDAINTAIKENAREQRRNDSIELVSEEENSIETINYVSDRYIVKDRKKVGKDSIFKVIEFYHTGEKFSELSIKNGYLEGISTFYHKNDKLFAKINYSQNNFEEVLELKSVTGEDLKKGSYKKGNGILLFYNPINDEIEREISYVNYKKEGPFTAYYYSGEIKAKGYFKNDTLEGELKVLYKNGKQREAGIFKKGKFEGVHAFYFINGARKKTEIWNNGTLQFFQEFDKKGRILTDYSKNIEKRNSYHSNGNIHSKTTLVNGMKHGAFIYYYENSKTRAVETWINDTLMSEKLWHENGCLNSITNYKSGLKNGLFKEYYSNGKVRLLQEYKDGLKNGESVSYFANGKVYAIGFYVNDKPKGRFHIFNDKGKYRGTNTYF